MDTKNFLKEIRSIIREEIEYALNKQTKNESKELNLESLKHGISLYKKMQEKKDTPNQKQKSFPVKKDSGLSIQSILDETRRSIQENYDDGYDEIKFTTDSLNAFSKNHIDATPSGVDPNDIAPEVAQALTRDYSALMAKINEKKGV